jgi:hypothetical protein
MNGMGYEAALVIAKYAKIAIITGYNHKRFVFSS